MYYISNYLYFSIFPKVVAVQALMKFYDVDGDGCISYNEFLQFLRGLREPMNERRSTIVKKAFAEADKDGSGIITVANGNKVNLDQFVDYYSDLSATITNDAQFVAKVESTFSIGEDEE